MTLRPARSVDVFDMAGLLEMQQARSRYAGKVAVDSAYARKLLAQAVQRHGGTHDGGTLVNVIENREGVICGFCVGVLNRVYHIGDMLAAQDMFLVASPSAPKMAARRLLSAYIEWAAPNPDVYEIHLSHTDALPEGNRMGTVYERMGFTKCGGIFRRDAKVLGTEGEE